MLKTIHQIRQAFIEDVDLQRAYSELCWCVGSRLGADLVCLTSFSSGPLGVWKSDNSETLEQGLQISPEISGYSLSGQPIKLPVYISHGERAQAEAVLLKELSARGSRSYACAPICLGPNKLGKIEVFFNKAHHIFRVEDFYLLESLADVAAYRMYTFPTEEPQIKEISHFGEFENVLAKGDLIFLRTNLNQQIVEIKGDTTRVLGVAPETLLNSREVWAKIVHPDDLRKLARNISDNNKSQEFRVEIRVVNQKTSNQRWLLGASGSSSGKGLEGWAQSSFGRRFDCADLY